MPLSSRERTIRARLRDDFAHYAARALRIRTKDPGGGLVPFVLNAAQKHLHARIEAQLERTGRVRVLVLKGRQQGVSTYVGGRFYWRATHGRGVRAFILSHEQAATDNLFGIVERFHGHCPALVRPSTGTANARELGFDVLDSGYAVGTAGTRAAGRSQTIQLFHGSEVAFWPNAEAHFAGVVQAVPDAPGTEIILESTANGIGGAFHERWQRAEAGIGDYEAIFIPWFWSDEYRRETADDFRLDAEEAEYAALHGLDASQMAWRRNKIAELRDPLLFRQEYPATAAEAFQMTGHDSFIPPDLVVRARKATLAGIGPLAIGADPARFGDDRFALAFRRGRRLEKIVSRQKIDTVAGANWLRQVIDADRPARVFIDVGGIGAGVFDLLRSFGYAREPGIADPRKVVVPIDFAGSPQDPEIMLPSGEMRPGPFNRRAEMWLRSRDWLTEPGGAQIPDEDALQADACGPSYHYNANAALLLESKEHMRARGVRSPDAWDAVALTFAEPVGDDRPGLDPLAALRSRSGGSWMGR
jgi:hypothetical protein